MVMSDIIFVVSYILLVRACLGTGSFSGEGMSPMYGDFEAQRHWLEITSNLNIGDWYRHTKDNDLLYWGLDYPPLTAYVSWMFGKFASLPYIYPTMISLKTSRGIEDAICKTFMRISVILCDMITFIPSMFYLSNNSIGLFVISALNPALLLIDHGHFQYNGTCIGLAMLAISNIDANYDVIGSILFCLSLNFKQISLYYAPIYFIILLRKCILHSTTTATTTTTTVNFYYRNGFFHLTKIGLTVILTFGILWYPFCYYASTDETCLSSLAHVLSRQFPFNRGIFEDKVANLWFCLSVLIDIRQYATVQMLAVGSLILTIILLLPVCYFTFFLVNIEQRDGIRAEIEEGIVKKKVQLNHYLTALSASALAFFLASFQVHEKSILFALVPALLQLRHDLLFCVWFQVIGVFSLVPLLIKDGHGVVGVVATLGIFITLVIIDHVYNQTKENEEEIEEKIDYGNESGPKIDSTINRTSEDKDDIVIGNVTLSSSASSFLASVESSVSSSTVINKVFHCCFYLSAICIIPLYLATLLVQPPARYPDLWPVLTAIVGAACFLLAYLYQINQLYIAYSSSFAHAHGGRSGNSIEIEKKKK